MPALEDAYAELVRLTHISQEEWQDILTLPEAAQALVLQGYKDCDWAVPSSSTLVEVIAVLEIIGGVVGVAAGIAGGVPTVIAALRAL